MGRFAFHSPDSIPRLFHKIAEYQFNNANRLVKKFNLTVEQVSVMFIVHENNGISQKELARKTFKDQANITRITKRLINKNLLEIKGIPSDKRVNLVYITPKGKEFMEKVFKAIEDYAEYANSFFRPQLIEDIKNNLKEYVDIIVQIEDRMKEYTDNMPVVSLD